MILLSDSKVYANIRGDFLERGRRMELGFWKTPLCASIFIRIMQFVVGFSVTLNDREYSYFTLNSGLRVSVSGDQRIAA